MITEPPSVHIGGVGIVDVKLITAGIGAFCIHLNDQPGGVIVVTKVIHRFLSVQSGLPFGIHRMCVWIVPGGDSLGGGAALFVLNFVIGGIIGGFVLVWRLLVAAWYVPLTIYRLIVGY